jgi:hypothetical protein
LQPAKTNVTESAKGPGDPAKRQQIERIIHSGAFRERDSLKRLLTYLADRTFHGAADGLKEYTVGVEVFHKPDGYDPQRDGSVRQHIGKLRQKLEEYYRSEGVSDQIHIELPKRQFRLVFQDLPPHQGARRPYTAWATAAGLALLVAFAYWLGSRHSGAADLDPSVRAVWEPFLDSARPTVVCLGTPLFFRNRSLRVRESHLNVPDLPESQAELAEMQKKLGVDSLVPTFDYTGIGEAYAAFEVSHIFAAARKEVALTRGNVLSWNEVRNENVIFLGAPKSNPQLAAITDNLDFRMDRDRSMVTNAHPRAGEPAAYQRVNAADLNAAEDYVLIDRLPGIDGSGRILILEGASTASNWAAADYLTRPGTARELLTKVKLPNGKARPFFQVLLHVKYKDLVPTRTELAAFRAVVPR